MWLPWFLYLLIISPINSHNSPLSRHKRDVGEKRVVCYYTNWSVYRPGTAKFNPQNINPYLCTHLVYAFGGLTKDNSLKPFDKYQDIEQGGYAKFNGLKTYNKNLKTMVAIGGWNEGSARFSPLVADADRRKEFVRNIIKFLRQNHFDGLDLDWEYPAFRDGGKQRDRDNYATLVQEIREEFNRESSKTGRTRLLLTMAVPAGIEYIDKGYDIPRLNENLDWLNILSYDYHSAFEPSVDHHAPLYSLEPDDEYNFGSQLNIDATVKHYLKLGADRNKLVLGIPTYGRSYTLFNPDARDIGSPADGPGEQGEATREKGYLAYYEICERVKNDGWTVVNPNPDAMGPFAYKDNQWVGYDDEDIARAKARYVNDNDLGGIMFWSLDNDDFRGKCHGKQYPIIEAAKEALLATGNELAPSEHGRRGSSTNNNNNKKQSTSESSSKPKNRKTRPRQKTSTEVSRTTRTTPAYSTTTPLPPTTPDPGSDFVCKDEGFFPHPRDCKKYFWCLDSGPSSLGIVAHQFTCPSGLVFNKISDSCDYARNVICTTKTTTTTTSTPSSSSTTKTTTARSRIAITAAPPRHTTTTTTTTTTTEAPEEYEEYDEEEEEDPGTIKELIALIKRLGGVEQLEKQLAVQEASGKGTIKSSLYSKVLSGRTGNRFRGNTPETSTSKYQSLFRNRPAGPQSANDNDEKETSKYQEKPQYITIQRNRVPSRRPPEPEDEKEEAEEEDTEEVVEQPKDTRRRPGGSSEKEYVTLRRTNTRKGEEKTPPKYKNIQRTRSTTEQPVSEETAEEEDEDDDDSSVREDRSDVSDKPKKYSAVYRENHRSRGEAEGEETTRGKVSGLVRPQYVTLARRDKVTDATPSDPVNIVNKDEGQRRKNQYEDSSTVEPEIVNNVNSPKYAEIRRRPITNKQVDVETPTEKTQSTQSSDSSSLKYASIRRRPVSSTESVEDGTQVSSATDDSLESPAETTESTTTLIQGTTETTIRSTREENERVNFLERRNDPTTEAVIRRRTRLPVLTTQPYTEPTSPQRIRSRTTTETTPAAEIRSNRLRIRQRINLSATTASPSVSEATVPSRRFHFAPRTKPTVLSPIVKNETFTIIVPETTIPFDWTTLPTIAAESTESGKSALPATAFQKIRSTSRSPPTTSTVTRVVTSITESSFTERQKIMVTKKPTFVKRVTKPTTEKTTIDKTPLERSTRAYSPRRSLRLSTTTTTTSTTTERPRPKSRNSRFRPRTTTPSSEESTVADVKFVPKKGRARGFRKFSEESVEVSKESTTLTPTTKVPPSRRTIVSRRIKFPKEDLQTEPTGNYYEDVDNDELHNKFIIGESVKQNSGRNYLSADVLFATVPTVESEENSAISQKITSTSTTTVRTPLGRGKNSTRTSQVNRAFRGRVKAVESITEHIPDDYRRRIKKVIHKRPSNSQRSVTTEGVRLRVPQESEPVQYIDSLRYIESDSSEPVTSTARPSTIAPRRSSQDYLTSLRARSRTTTSTTPQPITEHFQRRPVGQIDRRRKFRPTARPDNLSDNSEVTTSRSVQHLRRRTRPTTSTTTTSTTTVEPITSFEETEEEELEEEIIDLPDLANPAVVAIHNLATIAPVPVRDDSEVSAFTPSSPTPFTLPRVSTPSFRDVTTYRQNTGNRQTVATSYADFRQSSGSRQPITTRLTTPSTTIRGVTAEALDTPSTRNEVVIAPRRLEATTRPPVQYSEVVISSRHVDRTTQLPPIQYSEVIIAPRKPTTQRAPTERKIKPFSKVPRPGTAQRVTKPEQFSQKDYEYYDDADPLADVPPSALKVKVHSDGYIECLDQGNFPHPFSCKKFISCAKMENTELLGWEYTCPKHLSFDPVGGICNWSAGLGCQH